MSSNWFHVPELSSGEQLVRLPEQESHHAFRVRRLKPGDEICVFDGNGTWGKAHLGPPEKQKGCRVHVLETRTTPPPEPAVHLCVALPKGDRFGTLLNMLSQLGVTSVTPLLCQHGVVRPEKKHGTRAARIFVEACKQSRNPWLPRWHDPVRPDQLPERGGHVFFAHPGGSPLTGLMAGSDEITILVGPEAGFSDQETETLEDAGARRLSLGPRILRIETAAIALLAAARLNSVAVNSPDESLS